MSTDDKGRASRAAIGTGRAGHGDGRRSHAGAIRLVSLAFIGATIWFLIGHAARPVPALHDERRLRPVSNFQNTVSNLASETPHGDRDGEDDAAPRE